ncbi:MAG TPA: DUF932 domain-containing protein [Sedimentisphaerales bacterium]|nr:DUF932 domain-containing protein [Sedimentisphaerales bacterium]HRS12584.1 DUF932 domain-containing protein [Sedimentisphaerales bacterium]HRV49222.1 DUF932 domain-containing protein [Sedimentisphaerales bacterium]
MQRLTQLDDILFPVEEHPVFASVTTASGEQRLPIPDKKAIVNCDSNRVVGVVSRGYRLVSNREALGMAYECCRTVFPETEPGEWEVRATDAPAGGGHCFIDMAHNSTKLDFKFVPAKDRPDAFGPFIRVTNSYNTLRALAFDIGFYRKVCSNGLILPESVIRFKFTHLRREIGERIQFEIDHDKLAKFKASFAEYLRVLYDCPVKRTQFEPLMFAALLLHKPKHAKPGSLEASDWDALVEHVTAMCERYAGELGENAYAVFNAITEFASHPPENRCVFRERHSFERLAGVWVNEFSRVSQEPGFDLGKYIEKIGKNDGEGTEAAARPHRGQDAGHD